MTTHSELFAISRTNPKIMTIAHRGAWKNAPENSFLAVEHAIMAGADMVEIDTQKCLTGEFVVIHDDTLDRTTNGKGLVSETTLEQLQTLHLRQGAGGEGSEVTTQPLPLLSDLLAYAKGKILVNIDAKHPEDLPDIITEVERLNMQDIAVVKSTYNPEEAEWTTLTDTVKHMPMMHARRGHFLDDLQTLAPKRPIMIELSFDDLHELQQAKPLLESMDCRIWINTLDPVHPLDMMDSTALINPEKVWGTLINAGVGAIQTDLPEYLAQWLKQRDAFTE